MSKVAEQPQPEKENVVGPSLAGRNIGDLKIAELKHFLRIIRATIKGKKLT